MSRKPISIVKVRLVGKEQCGTCWAWQVCALDPPNLLLPWSLGLTPPPGRHLLLVTLTTFLQCFLEFLSQFTSQTGPLVGVGKLRRQGVQAPWIPFMNIGWPPTTVREGSGGKEHGLW